MEKIFDDYGIEIFNNEEEYIIRYESGEIACVPEDIKVSKADAEKAQLSAESAYDVVLKYQNMNMFSEN